MEANSVDAIVTDPPYGLEFMGKGWDHGVPGVPFWTEALRVLKPGGHLLAFGGTRTHHRLMVAIEDAGFEIRDCLMWLFGSGFPKSHNLNGDWDGWGTALKPAYEPIILARKPLIGTVAANVTQYGTGALNIDGCRIEGEPWQAHDATGLASVKFFTNGEAKVIHKEPHAQGRWPANVCLDEDAAALLDQMSGERKAGSPKSGLEPKAAAFSGNLYGDAAANGQSFGGYGDTGGASRFFYVAKASRSERNAGLDGMPEQRGPVMSDRCVNCGRGRMDGRRDGPCCANPQYEPTPVRGNVANHHPTVKPVALMRWLVRLVTPPGGVVLDPFLGSGTTLVAARLEGFDGIGIEQEAEYVEIAKRRIPPQTALPLEVPA